AGFLRAEGCGQVKVVPHGCTLPEKVAPFPQQFTPAYLGQVGPDKGLIFLLQAWSGLSYANATLVLAGPGTEALGPWIQSVAGRGKFHLKGWVKEAREVYDGCSVYVQPSVCESFGIEVLEALAHGRPVIVSQGAGASELVEEGITGFVVPTRDPSALAEKIDWCRRNPDRLAEMGARGREKAAGYTWERVRAMYKEAWRGW
ncbi:MAG: glycosyltransferase family 4 protein, partial [Chloroflexota bacterium]|nr:glycosyltransferase family 4 protein [Chloroflexota bacterium]